MQYCIANNNSARSLRWPHAKGGSREVSDWNNKIIDEFHAKGGSNVGPFGDRLLLLTTRGARTGRRHTTPLAFTRDGEHYVVAASMGGAPRHPAWYHNLVKNPAAEVEVGSDTFMVHATPLPSGSERDRLYEQHAQVMPGFRGYQEKTTRIIPVVLLDRAESKHQLAA
jgi:deazaflavin-dependent oxidoreductase (nitroreductase family)